MALDSNYVTAVDLNPYFVDKSTGEPLAGGVVSFYEDNNRVIGKPVYQLTGSPPNYTYTALPNPMILSNTGTFQDTNGNDIAVYYYPYDENGDIQLYYITVVDSLGTPQFTREAWPNEFAPSTSTSQTPVVNQISNSQFSQISFVNPLTITTAGAGTVNVNIAPGWFLNLTTSAVGSVTVAQNAVAGTSAYPYNPPFTLTVTPGANVTGLSLTQRLTNNPDIWSPQNVGAANGWVATSVLVAAGSSLAVNYVPSTGPTQNLLTANNTGGVYAEFTNTIQLTPPANTDTGATGYININIVLPVATPTTLGNIQVVPLQTNITGVTYGESSINNQISQLMYYYLPLLKYKPIKSYLVGWDFPLNPLQFAPASITVAAANVSSYYWDNTIIFQNATHGVTVTPAASGAISILSNNNTQFALVQYIPAPLANAALQNNLSVNIAAATAAVGGLQGTVSLWYTTGALPSTIGASQSIVASLTAAGKPATFNGAWVEIPRNGLGSTANATSLLGDAVFTVGSSATSRYNDYGFSGWTLSGNAAVNTATFMAIVVGFAPLSTASSINIESISLVPGDIPTRPAPQTPDEVLRDCQYYYEKSFDIDVLPVVNGGHSGQALIALLSTDTSHFQYFPTIYYKVTKYSTAPVGTIYNPVGNNNFCGVVEASAVDSCTTTTIQCFQSGFLINFTPPVSAIVTDSIVAQWTIDSRLGQ
jgi:hypothetical protein